MIKKRIISDIVICLFALVVTLISYIHFRKNGMTKKDALSNGLALTSPILVCEAIHIIFTLLHVIIYIVKKIIE